MAENKTKPTEIQVEEFIRQSDPKKIEDSLKLVGMMERLSGEKATMWGPSIIGFGSYHYKYDSGHEGDMCAIGFSPRKAEFSLYVINSDSEKQTELTKNLGKIKMGKACIYFKKLDDLNLDVLENLITESLKSTKEKWG
ncbi:DUF1801 domain-containing protein [Chryseobacterium sp.]|uniref:DUF1801 domain-containing protein n=1 Tax=Chryseobacterium sp. TaxID=1871047 RepID=UPI0011C8BA0A|nr:DUF1801 domain-containing protein [Chryseobacterium sp.]TXF78889.1 DUF1801 domain-containing protein [Chryseobacterium sp.]